MQGVLTDAEKEIAYKVANRAMIAGWDRAVGWAAAEYGVSQLEVKALLNKAADFNDTADPSARISELDDWKKEKQGRSERASGSKLHRLSPGLRAYMEAKTNSSTQSQQ